MQWHGDELKDLIKRGAKRGLDEILLDIEVAALAVMPFRDGALRNETVHRTGEFDDATHSVSGYVISNIAYAAAQHEGHATQERKYAVGLTSEGWRTFKNTPYAHTVEWVAKHYTTPGTGPKFLSNPLKARMATMADTIQNAIAEELGS